MAKHRLYHKDKPEGRIFSDIEDIKKAIKDGWEDAPMDHPYKKVKKVRIRKITVKRNNKDSGII